MYSSIVNQNQLAQNRDSYLSLHIFPCHLPLKQLSIVPASQQQFLMCALFGDAVFVAVSYTHLDVYKRQTHGLYKYLVVLLEAKFTAFCQRSVEPIKAIFELCYNCARFCHTFAALLEKTT